MLRILVCLALVAFARSFPYGNEVESGEFEEDLLIDFSTYDPKIFGSPDNATGEELGQWKAEEAKMNPEEVGTYLEGDMIVPKGTFRNGMRHASYRWANGIVPYEIAGSFNQREMDIIRNGFKEYETKTCIRFVKRTNERDYISITNERSGCWSSVGKIGYKQQVNVQSPECMTLPGTFIHELMHAIGFLHEQNRHERDSYVTINWSNIKSGVSNNFDKASATTTDAFGVGYDYGSVMHYSSYAFSRNGQPTIVAKQNSPGVQMGQRTGFSAKDIAKINSMYGCSASGSRPLTTGNTGSTGSYFRPTSTGSHVRPSSVQYPNNRYPTYNRYPYNRNPYYSRPQAYPQLYPEYPPQPYAPVYPQIPPYYPYPY